jgi:hypothetical protein
MRRGAPTEPQGSVVMGTAGLPAGDPCSRLERRPYHADSEAGVPARHTSDAPVLVVHVGT